MSAYCERRVPPDVRDKVRVEFRVSGEKIILTERRPPWRGGEDWTAMDIAQFRRDQETGHWVLYFADRNTRWHRYEGVRPTKTLRPLLAEVDRDPSGIFWG